MYNISKIVTMYYSFCIIFVICPRHILIVLKADTKKDPALHFGHWVFPLLFRLSLALFFFLIKPFFLSSVYTGLCPSKYFKSGLVFFPLLDGVYDFVGHISYSMYNFLNNIFNIFFTCPMGHSIQVIRPSLASGSFIHVAHVLKDIRQFC